VAVGFIKEGAGTWKLTGPNAYIGNTTVSNGVLALSTNSLGANGEMLGSAVVTLVAPGSLNVLERTDATFNLGGGGAQTLAGNGSVVGSLAVSGAGVLSPGFSIGTLTVSGNLSIPGGNYLVEINPAAAQTSDRVVAQNVDLNSAVITVTNIGNTLATGDTFQILQASGVISGTPAAVTGGVPPGPGASWDLSNLNVNGTIKAILPPSPTLTNSVSGGGTTLDFAWDPAYLGWRLYVQTNTVNIGLSTNWVPVVGTENTTTHSEPIDVTHGAVFYRLAYP
jgi:autotransporter-associated beta strand protein